MKNLLLREPVRAKIDVRVERLLRELGSPEPPLNLDHVRHVLKLDRDYFSGSDDRLITQTLHRLKLAGKQVIRRPTLLLDAIQKFELRALYLPDRKQILLDRSVPELKHRWLEAHEVGHDLIDWHRPFMFGDNDHTPTPACHDKLEAEANYAAGQLLFLQERFVAEARDLPREFSSLQKLKHRYGNTLTSTLWRYVELLDPNIPLCAVVSAHPHVSQRSESFNAEIPCKHFIQSQRFSTQFSLIDEKTVFALISQYCRGARKGPLGAAEVELTDDVGQRHVFRFETFYNGYDALTLGFWSRLVSLVV